MKSYLLPFLLFLSSSLPVLEASPARRPSPPSVAAVIESAGNYRCLGEGDEVVSSSPGPVADVFDLNLLLSEHAARGTVTIFVKRGGRDLSCDISGYRGGIQARPRLSGEDAALYREASGLASEGRAADAAKLLRDLSVALAAEGRPSDACWALLAGGRFLERSSDRDAAAGLYGKALELARQSGRKPAVAEALSHSAGNLRFAGDGAKAEELVEELIGIRSEAGGRSLALAEAYNNKGLIMGGRGDLEGARANYGLSLAIIRELLPGSLLHAKSLSNLGEIARKRGDLAEAERLHRQALEIREREAPGASEHAVSLLNLGIVMDSRGDIAEAEKLYGNALAIFEKVSPGSMDVARSLNNLGLLAKDRGDLDAAMSFYQRSLEIKERLFPDSVETATTLNNLGVAARLKGDTGTAADFYGKALEIREKRAPGSLEVASSLVNLTALFLHTRDLPKARFYCERALEITSKQAPWSLVHADNLNNMGLISMGEGNHPEARRKLDEALRIKRELAPSSATEAKTLFNIGQLCLLEGDRACALEFMRSAVNAIEGQKSRLGGGRDASDSFSGLYADYYRQLVDIEIGSGFVDEAFATLERFRARSLLEMLAERELDFARDAPAALLEEQRLAALEYDRVTTRLSRTRSMPGADELDALRASQIEARKRLTDVADRIRAASPRLASLEFPDPLGFPETAATLGRRELFVSFCVSLDRTHVFTVLDGKLGVHTAVTGRKPLARKIALFRRLLADPSSDEKEIDRVSSDLYDTLLRPVSGQLRKAALVVVCPDGPLHALPFAALEKIGGGGKGRRKPVVNALSATVRAELAREVPAEKRAVGAPVVFADPAYGQGPGGVFQPLPHSGREAADICALFGSCRMFTGKEASESNAKSLGKETIPFIHFACHGVVDEKFPLSSGLALSPPADAGSADNGLLQAWEILEQVRIDADLVTLSACDSGLGKEMGGEGLVGLTRAFHYAGARAVLSSLWSVSDESTAEIMRRFYAHLRNGEGKASALRAAQEEMAGTEEFSHPFHWAGLVLSGASN